jgi:NAD(P)-dependent dehydrogenase (short-subunit alcohol dehydrogenase family)
MWTGAGTQQALNTFQFALTAALGHATRSLARTWTTDLKDRRIRVNAISPSTIDAPGLSELLASGEAGEQRKKMVISAIPLGRFGRPDEISKAVVFLASDDSSYINGTELFVDGGFAQV